jgi:hypothetical protein
MAIEAPAPLLLLICTTIEALLVVLAKPDLLPQHFLVWLTVSLAAINSFIYLVYTVEIYPRWISPLRHLPLPKVCSSKLRNKDQKADKTV